MAGTQLKMDEKDSLESQIVNLAFLEEMYQQSRSQKVDPSWMQFFQQFEEEQAKAPSFASSSQEHISKTERIHHLFNCRVRMGKDLRKRRIFRADDLKYPCHLHLVMAQMKAADAGKDFLFQAVNQGVDLPVFRKENPVRRLNDVPADEPVFGFHRDYAGDIQGPERIEGDKASRHESRFR